MKPYQTLDELPQALRNELPELAQRLYLAVFQRTWENCEMGGVSSNQELTQTSHDAAMLAVQQRFDKNEHGQWRQSPVGEEIDVDKLTGNAPDVEED